MPLACWLFTEAIDGVRLKILLKWARFVYLHLKARRLMTLFRRIFLHKTSHALDDGQDNRNHVASIPRVLINLGGFYYLMGCMEIREWDEVIMSCGQMSALHWLELRAESAMQHSVSGHLNGGPVKFRGQRSL